MKRSRELQGFLDAIRRGQEQVISLVKRGSKLQFVDTVQKEYRTLSGDPKREFKKTWKGKKITEREGKYLGPGGFQGFQKSRSKIRE